MSVFKDLGFKKRNEKIVAPSTKKIKGYNKNELLSYIGNDTSELLIEAANYIITPEDLTNGAITYSRELPWKKYQIIVTNLTGSVVVNGKSQVVQLSKDGVTTFSQVSIDTNLITIQASGFDSIIVKLYESDNDNQISLVEEVLDTDSSVNIVQSDLPYTMTQQVTRDTWSKYQIVAKNIEDSSVNILVNDTIQNVERTESGTFTLETLKLEITEKPNDWIGYKFEFFDANGTKIPFNDIDYTYVGDDYYQGSPYYNSSYALRDYTVDEKNDANVYIGHAVLASVGESGTFTFNTPLEVSYIKVYMGSDTMHYTHSGGSSTITINGTETFESVSNVRDDLIQVPTYTYYNEVVGDIGEITVNTDANFDDITVNLYNLHDVVESTPVEVTDTFGSVHDIFDDSSAVATYQLDGDATDLGGNYDGTATNVTFTDGKFGQAAVFNELTNDYIMLPNTKIIPDNEFAISVWLEQSSLAKDEGLINFGFGSRVSIQAADDSGMLTVRLVDSNNNFILNNSANGTITAPSFTVNTLHHVVVTVNATSAKMYIDGVLDAEVSINWDGTHIANNGENSLGRLTSTMAANGTIDQLRIFNRALTSQEVTSLYNETTFATIVEGTDTPESINYQISGPYNQIKVKKIVFDNIVGTSYNGFNDLRLFNDGIEYNFGTLSVNEPTYAETDKVIIEATSYWNDQDYHYVINSIAGLSQRENGWITSSTTSIPSESYTITFKTPEYINSLSVGSWEAYNVQSMDYKIYDENDNIISSGTLDISSTTTENIVTEAQLYINDTLQEIESVENKIVQNNISWEISGGYAATGNTTLINDSYNDTHIRLYNGATVTITSNNICVFRFYDYTNNTGFKLNPYSTLFVNGSVCTTDNLIQEDNGTYTLTLQSGTNIISETNGKGVIIDGLTLQNVEVISPNILYTPQTTDTTTLTVTSDIISGLSVVSNYTKFNTVQQSIIDATYFIDNNQLPFSIKHDIKSQQPNWSKYKLTADIIDVQPLYVNGTLQIVENSVDIIGLVDNEVIIPENISYDYTSDLAEDISISDKILIVDGETTGIVGNVYEKINDNTNTVVHDIFSDGSSVATYQLDGNANDLGGNYDGTATNVTYTPGKFGDAALGNGINSYINTGDVILDNQDYTFSMWVNLTQKDKIGFFHLYDISRATSMFLGVENNIWKLNIKDTEITTSGISFGEWHHVLATYTSSTSEWELFIDNISIGTVIGKIPVNEVVELFDIKDSGSTFATPGQIDQVRIFNKVLTQEEVNSLYNESGQSYYITSPDTISYDYIEFDVPKIVSIQKTDGSRDYVLIRFENDEAYTFTTDPSYVINGNVYVKVRDNGDIGGVVVDDFLKTHKVLSVACLASTQKIDVLDVNTTIDYNNQAIFTNLGTYVPEHTEIEQVEGVVGQRVTYLPQLVDTRSLTIDTNSTIDNIGIQTWYEQSTGAIKETEYVPVISEDVDGTVIVDGILFNDYSNEVFITDTSTITYVDNYYTDFGVNNYIDIPDIPIYENEMTFALRYRSTSVGNCGSAEYGYAPSHCMFGDSTISGYIGLGLENGLMCVSNGTVYTKGTVRLDDTQWHTLVWTTDGLGNWELFADGVHLGSVTGATVSLSTYQYIRHIGAGASYDGVNYGYDISDPYIRNSKVPNEAVKLILNSDTDIKIKQEENQPNWTQYKVTATNPDGDLIVNNLIQVVENINEQKFTLAEGITLDSDGNLPGQYLVNNNTHQIQTANLESSEAFEFIIGKDYYSANVGTYSASWAYYVELYVNDVKIGDFSNTTYVNDGSILEFTPSGTPGVSVIMYGHLNDKVTIKRESGLIRCYVNNIPMKYYNISDTDNVYLWVGGYSAADSLIKFNSIVTYKPQTVDTNQLVFSTNGKSVDEVLVDLWV